MGQAKKEEENPKTFHRKNVKIPKLDIIDSPRSPSPPVEDWRSGQSQELLVFWKKVKLKPKMPKMPKMPVYKTAIPTK